VQWVAKERLPDPGNDHVRLLFRLQNAKLYSFWME
jgi:hypothetical protein